jgi:hypothetical protein
MKLCHFGIKIAKSMTEWLNRGYQVRQNRNLNCTTRLQPKNIGRDAVIASIHPELQRPAPAVWSVHETCGDASDRQPSCTIEL